MLLKRLTAPFAAAALLAIPGSAFAQVDWRQPSDGIARYGDNAAVSYYDARRTAHDQGYREGVKEGEKDARQGDRFEYRDEKQFQRADKGFHRSFGDRERYRQVFRDAFASGYQDAYSRLSGYGRYGGRPGSYGRQAPYGQQGGYGNWGIGQSGRYPRTGYYSPAFDNGARDGYEKGREDARDRDAYDPLRHKWYRSGDHDYRSQYGSKEAYRNVYREGFRTGYDRGYREATYRW